VDGESSLGVEGIAAADRFVAVDCQVADFLDGEDLGEEAGFQVLPEARFVDQGGQVVGIGFLQVGVIGIMTAISSERRV